MSNTCVSPTLSSQTIYCGKETLQHVWKRLKLESLSSGPAAPTDRTTVSSNGSQFTFFLFSLEKMNQIIIPVKLFFFFLVFCDAVLKGDSIRSDFFKHQYFTCFYVFNGQQMLRICCRFLHATCDPYDMNSKDKNEFHSFFFSKSHTGKCKRAKNVILIYFIFILALFKSKVTLHLKCRIPLCPRHESHCYHNMGTIFYYIILFVALLHAWSS